jgi:hypothetical protein
VQFGSWTFDATRVDLQAGQADLSEYMINGEWDL